MDFMFLNKFTLLFLLIISGSLLSTSFAGRASKFMRNSDEDVNEVATMKAIDEEDVSIIHERLLRANTKDYGRYDPTPTFSKPPYKLIPN
ncbi:protein CASPARIAN STRIP INTEGRITY FACTOR 1-like [Vicia villosa]|uniref:protein CASPARIAN STRIP INTEGRITY FACTOR 1-like n=1 Tax=Vicia villosa TaxID=3911 RepID=UPI00273BD37A|nr:protein CASPARIAN STRIP INTEGRITY FACTOR 1-like [Vicia villosa]